MISIAIVDDDPEICTTLDKYITDMFRQLNNDIQYYKNGKEFLENVSEEKGVDIVFMDIQMPECDGREAASKLREFTWGKNTILVFISSHSDNLIPLFALHPFDYIKKPLNSANINKLLLNILEYIDSFYAAVAVKDGRNINHVLISEIVYVEIKDGRKLRLHLSDGSQLTEYNKINDFISEVESKNHSFVKIHTSIAVNIRYVKIFNRTHVVLLDGTILSVSESYAKNMNKKYLNLKMGRIKK